MIEKMREINERTHVREGLRSFMEYFSRKYGIGSCSVFNISDNSILYARDVSAPLPYELILRKNGLEDVRLYLDRDPEGLFTSAEAQIDLEFLKSVILNHLLYRSVLRISKSRMQKKKEVETLMEISRELIFLHEESSILNALIFAIMGQVMVTKTAIYLNQSETFSLKVFRGFKKLPSRLGMVKTLRNILDLNENQEYLMNPEMEEIHKAGGALVVPMQYQNSITGYIVLGHKTDGKSIPETEYDFLFSLAANVAFALENSKLIHESIEKKRMESELNLAREIQQNLLPKNIPRTPGWEIWGANIPSREVGGDYYFIRKVNNKIYIAIADVTGKSVPAALLVSTLHAALFVLSDLEMTLPDLVADINHLIFSSTTAEQFITFFILEMDLEKESVTYINAGHNPPYLLSRSGELKELTAGGLLLGIVPKTDFQTGEFPLGDLESLLLFTDGVTEATNGLDEEYGEERLKSHMRKCGGKSASEWGGLLLEEVRRFKDSPVPQDDVTVVILKKSEDE